MNIALMRRRRMGGSLSLSAQVEAILAGTTGFALDPSDLSTLFQDTAGTVPVTTAGQAVARINSKWGTTAYEFAQAAAANRPASSDLRSLAFAVDDLLDIGSNRFFSNEVGMTFTARVVVDTLAAAQGIINVSRGGSTTLSRWLMQVTSAGQLSQFCRRGDGDPGNTASSAGGLITAGVPFTVQGQVNFATDVARILLNGTEVATTAQGGTSGQTRLLQSRGGQLSATCLRALRH
ncbi:MAG: hypothetical protein HC834_03300 [Rhodospirillales bacterium]|nr:hypothetical protein [Rhodospirillales bacterium]